MEISLVMKLLGQFSMQFLIKKGEGERSSLQDVQ